VVQVADETTGTGSPDQYAPSSGSAGGNPKAPGWYPDRANPNDQAYWDGQDWTARRRWTAGQGWLVVGDAPEDPMTSDAGPPPAGPRLSGNPYASAPRRRSTSTGFTFNLGVLLLLVCGIALMYGSIGAWVHVHGSVGFTGFSVSLNGTDAGISSLIGVNGWATFIGGILIVIFACFEMTSEELQLSILTTVIAAATTILAIYDMLRIVQKINQVPAAVGADVSVGWGLICVLSAAVLATLIALVRLLQR
jgi:hypothetical protein